MTKPLVSASQTLKMWLDLEPPTKAKLISQLRNFRMLWQCSAQETSPSLQYS